MPYVTMILLKRDDIDDCLLWMGGVVGFMIVLANSDTLWKHIMARWKGYGRVDKIK